MTLSPEILSLSLKFTSLTENDEGHFFEKCLPEGITSEMVEKIRRYESDFIAAIYLSLGKHVIYERAFLHDENDKHSFNINIGTEKEVHVMNAEFSLTDFVIDGDIVEGKIHERYVDCRFRAVAPEDNKNYQKVREELVNYARFIKANGRFN